EELPRLVSEVHRIGNDIVPGASWQGVRERLVSDPEGLDHPPDALLDIVRRLIHPHRSDLTRRHLHVPHATLLVTRKPAPPAGAGTLCDAPDVIRPLEVKLAPPGGALGVYYTGPSEDLSRPGSVWYALGDRTTFPLYQHRSTAYHEGFPGHHLQFATVRYLKDRLSRAQRLLVGTSGYAEGWGMYAEVLMGELGYLAEPSQYFGMLAKQMYRASRVVVDVGLHLGLDIDPSSAIAPGEKWTFENAVEFMAHYGMQDRIG